MIKYGLGRRVYWIQLRGVGKSRQWRIRGTSYQKLLIADMTFPHGVKIIHHMGRKKISELQQALEEVQKDNNRTQEEILDVSRKLQEAYKDKEEYWQ